MPRLKAYVHLRVYHIYMYIYMNSTSESVQRFFSFLILFFETQRFSILISQFFFLLLLMLLALYLKIHCLI